MDGGYENVSFVFLWSSWLNDTEERLKYKLSLYILRMPQEMKKIFWEFSHSSGELLKFDQRIVSKPSREWMHNEIRVLLDLLLLGEWFRCAISTSRIVRDSIVSCTLKSDRTFQKTGKIYFTIQFSLVIADILYFEIGHRDKCQHFEILKLSILENFKQKRRKESILWINLSLKIFKN